MRPPHFGWIWLKETLSDDAAVNIRMGIETRPKEIVPDPMECGGIRGSLPWELTEQASTVFYCPQPRLCLHRPPTQERSPASSMSPRGNASRPKSRARGPAGGPESGDAAERDAASGSREGDAPLEAYRRKRDPDRTPEPFGGAVAPAGERFVVQQHWARNMHF